ncbi:MAG: hypothetical protein JXI33_02125 [Candidatus Aminicenantes bacterium]|nr:hypothetical protein [Candidatus Aminicenantes bacterium]
MNLHLSKKNLVEIFIILLAGTVLGLGRNYFSQTPLPLFQGYEKKAMAEKQSQFAEVDVDFVSQLGVDPGTMLLDARPAELFRQGHIPGALSLPLPSFDEDITARLAHMRAARLLIIYCTGPDCNDSYELALKLQEKGCNDLLLYRGGIEDWLERGNALAR